MNTLQITAILKRNRITQKCFKGVFASDTIESFSQFPYCFVANTMRADTKGEHWVAFFVKNASSAEYFDSLGVWPPEVEEFVDFLQKFRNVKHSIAKIQAPYESSCGPHTIYFLVQRCRGFDFERIIKELQHPLSDAFVKLYVYQMFAR